MENSEVDCDTHTRRAWYENVTLNEKVSTEKENIPCVVSVKNQNPWFEKFGHFCVQVLENYVQDKVSILKVAYTQTITDLLLKTHLYLSPVLDFLLILCCSYSAPDQWHNWWDFPRSSWLPQCTAPILTGGRSSWSLRWTDEASGSTLRATQLSQPPRSMYNCNTVSMLGKDAGEIKDEVPVEGRGGWSGFLLSLF